MLFGQVRWAVFWALSRNFAGKDSSALSLGKIGQYAYGNTVLSHLLTKSTATDYSLCFIKNIPLAFLLYLSQMLFNDSEIGTNIQLLNDFKPE